MASGRGEGLPGRERVGQAQRSGRWVPKAARLLAGGWGLGLHTAPGLSQSPTASRGHVEGCPVIALCWPGSPRAGRGPGSCESGPGARPRTQGHGDPPPASARHLGSRLWGVGWKWGEPPAQSPREVGGGVSSPEKTSGSGQRPWPGRRHGGSGRPGHPTAGSTVSVPTARAGVSTHHTPQGGLRGTWRPTGFRPASVSPTESRAIPRPCLET